MANIPYSDNYLVCTSSALFILYHHRGTTASLKVELQQICADLGANVLGVQVSGYSHVLLRSANKLDVWLRKEKRNERPLDELSKVHELKYYMMDAYQVPAVSAYFMEGLREYIVCLADRPLVQWRDFAQHAVVREVELPVGSPTCMRVSSKGLLVGDEAGVLWLVKENGLTIEKHKALDGVIAGVEEMGDGRILVYGLQVAILSM